MMVGRCVILLAALTYTANAAEFILQSNFGWPLWIGIQGNTKPNGEVFEHLSNGGLELQPGQRISVYSQDRWQGRFWARTGCNRDNNWCETGDCAGNGPECQGHGGEPPATWAEISLKAENADDLDFYDISMVDGVNIPVSMEPIGGQGDGSPYSCQKCACAHDFNSDCPDDLRLYRDDRVVGCKSACLRWPTDEYCCRGDHGTPETCKASDWPVNYPAFFKERCPDAYSYAYDDHKSTFTCRATTYLIQFG